MLKKGNIIKRLGIGSLCLFLMGCSEETLLFQKNDNEPMILKEEVVLQTEASAETLEENGQEEEPAEKEAVEKETAAQEEKKIAVHICGAVMQPGVYYLKSGGRVCDGIGEAGGFREDADQEYLNQAMLLEDGMKLVVPTKEEAQSLKEASGEEAAAQIGIVSAPVKAEEQKNGKVDLNTADEALLSTLPGIGESRAKSILAYRREHGPFETIEDIMKVSGIKEAAFEKLKEYVTVSK